jgi:hypothetical protein
MGGINEHRRHQCASCNTKMCMRHSIDNKSLTELYLNSDGVKDFMNKRLQYIMTKFANDQTVLKLIKLKCTSQGYF